MPDAPTRRLFTNFRTEDTGTVEELRSSEDGLGRSHFRFCRIRYPRGQQGADDEFGYLLYVKLSLTGNEGEFLPAARRHQRSRQRHPACLWTLARGARLLALCVAVVLALAGVPVAERVDVTPWQATWCETQDQLTAGEARAFSLLRGIRPQRPAALFLFTDPGRAPMTS